MIYKIATLNFDSQHRNGGQCLAAQKRTAIEWGLSTAMKIYSD